ncbi:MAG: helix-turn-helix domain-containing protein [Candidatus Omnitrophota bacterium]
MNEKDKFLNLSEAAEFLGIDEEELRILAEEGKVPAYKVGGIFLRFKLDQLSGIKTVGDIHAQDNSLNESPLGAEAFLKEDENSFFGKIADFWHFFDFYVITGLLIIFIIYVILKWGIR